MAVSGREGLMAILGTFSRRYQRRRRNRKLYYLDAVVAVVPNGKGIIDLGASVGYYVSALRDAGYEAVGLDGTPNIERLSRGLVRWADLATDCSKHHGAADWAMFLEVGEHIPVKLEGRLFDEVSRIPTGGLIVSWAVPGQRGRGHVNCRSPEYVAAEFVKRGWKLDDEATEKARNRVGERLRRSLMVFVRVSSSEKGE